MNRRLVFITLLLAMSFICQGQVEYLRLSPSQKIIQRVGATDVTIEFSRPQMKGRVVFGDVVPYGKLWRTGANENTKIQLSHRVRIGKTEVAEGTYSLITKPGREHWEIYLYTDTDNMDVPDPIDSTKLIYLTEVNSIHLDRTEQSLVINLYDVTETNAILGVEWERTAVRIPITFYTKEAMERMIDKEFKQNISDYSIAASYYYQRDMELEKAKKLKELAMELKEQPSAWDYHSYGIILDKMGEKSEAVRNIEKSLKIATESKDSYLIKENTILLSKLKD